MRSLYDNVYVTLACVPTTASSTGVVTTGPGVDTAGYTTAALRVFVSSIGAGLTIPQASSLVIVLQESNDNGATDAFAAAADNTGTTIGATVQATAGAIIYSYRVEGLGLNRKRWLRTKLTHNLGGALLQNVFTSFAVLEMSRGYQLPVTENPATDNT